MLEEKITTLQSQVNHLTTELDNLRNRLAARQLILELESTIVKQILIKTELEACYELPPTFPDFWRDCLYFERDGKNEEIAPNFQKAKQLLNDIAIKAGFTRTPRGPPVVDMVSALKHCKNDGNTLAHLESREQICAMDRDTRISLISVQKIKKLYSLIYQ